MNINELIDNVEKVIVGKRDVIELLVTAMLAKGHVLIEDVPGVGKTQLVYALAKSCGGTATRVQFTPDVMPSDITGFSMMDMKTQSMEFKKGAVFCNFFIADEINRASPKSQSALLEVMEEGQVSIDGATYELPSPFMVLATQNPVETYGTFHLPEAQMDRFIMKISMGYPTIKDELDILNRNEQNISARTLLPVAECRDLDAYCEEAMKVFCSDEIKEYIIRITEATRKADYINLPVSPRGSIALYRTAKAYAFVKGRNYVMPDDVKAIAVPVLAHRIILSPKGKTLMGNNEAAIRNVMNNVFVPVSTQ